MENEEYFWMGGQQVIDNDDKQNAYLWGGTFVTRSIPERRWNTWETVDQMMEDIFGWLERFHLTLA